ncbi:MAG: hypothetical protein RMZ42_25075, partial [Nostoc sp. DedQUE05]|nr:hypothetical protein [Nostoc sp. DedQUE05]
WFSYVRTDYRDSLNNESHTTFCFTHNQQLKFYLGSKFILPGIMLTRKAMNCITLYKLIIMLAFRRSRFASSKFKLGIGEPLR